jgi:hypothetical protein
MEHSAGSNVVRHLLFVQLLHVKRYELFPCLLDLLCAGHRSNLCLLTPKFSKPQFNYQLSVIFSASSQITFCSGVCSSPIMSLYRSGRLAFK